MIDDELSKLETSALRDYADDPRVDRVWQRLDAELVGARVRVRSGLLLAPAFGVALFVAGVMVGRHSMPLHDASPQMAAEAPQSGEAPREPAPAAAAAEPVRPPQQVDKPRAGAAAGARTTHDAFVSNVESPVHAVENTPYTAAPAEIPEWQQRADAGDFRAARLALARAGGWEAARAGASPDQLMTLVDLGRFSGEREQAVLALRRLLDVFAGAPEAPLAAWTLGNLLEQGGDRLGAADAYALYRRLSPAGDFAEDAAARQVDAALAQGDAEHAAELIDQYAKDFPNGRRLAELREELEKRKADPEGAAVPSEAQPGATPQAAGTGAPAPEPAPAASE
jgi:hypothetical protein